MDLVTKCGIDLKLGIVQTAYANGGSTDYIEKELASVSICYPIKIKIKIENKLIVDRREFGKSFQKKN